MPFGVVNGVSRGMDVLDGGGDRRRKGAVLGMNLGRPIVTNCIWNGDALFPNYFGEDLFILNANKFIGSRTDGTKHSLVIWSTAN